MQNNNRFFDRSSLLSTARWIGSVVATDDARVGASLASTVGPSGGGRSSYCEATDSPFAEEFRSWRRGDEAGEDNEKGVGEEHREGNVDEVVMIRV